MGGAGGGGWASLEEQLLHYSRVSDQTNIKSDCTNFLIQAKALLLLHCGIQSNYMHTLTLTSHVIQKISRTWMTKLAYQKYYLRNFQSTTN